MRFIKFELIKDKKNNRIIFIPLGYDSNCIYSGDSFKIDFLTKKVTKITSYHDAYINDRYFSISFTGGIVPRQASGTNNLCRMSIRASDINHPYYFQLKGDEDMDFWFKRIIDVFKALSMHKSFKPIEIKKNKPTLNYFDWVYNDNL